MDRERQRRRRERIRAESNQQQAYEQRERQRYGDMNEVHSDGTSVLFQSLNGFLMPKWIFHFNSIVFIQYLLQL